MTEQQEQPEEKGQEVAVRETGQLDAVEKWVNEHGYGTFRLLDDGRRVLELGEQLRNSVILVGPVTNLTQIDRNWSPQLRPMRVNVNDDAECFKVASKKVGENYIDQMDLTAPTWKKLGELCGIQYVRTRVKRWPNGGGLDISVIAQTRQPDGTWRRVVASSDYDYAVEAELLEVDILEKWEKFDGPNTRKPADKRKPKPTAQDIRKQVLRQRQFAARTAETKAQSRCVKALTGLRTFPKPALASKPLMAVAWLMTPDLNDAGSRELVKMQYAESIADLYGTEDALTGAGEWAELAPGAEIPGEQTLLEPAREPEEEPESEEPETVEGTAETVDPTPAASDGTTGSITEQEPIPGADAPAGDDGTDWDEGETEPEREQIAKPEDSFTPPGGPFAGKPVSEIIKTPEGRKWLVGAFGKVRTDAKRDQILRWLSFAEQRQILGGDLNTVSVK